jgi:hypothetical protein
MTNGLSLTATLARLGYSHRQAPRGTYCHDIRRGDQIVFHGTAGETWRWLRETEQVTSQIPA